jgi:hypothetical protein
MIIQKTDDLLLYFKHDGLTLELDQTAISSNGLLELLRKTIKAKYPNVKSFGLSLMKEDVFEIQVSVISDMTWKI